MPEVHVPLVHGANEAVDPKLLPDGWLTRAENVRFRKDGRPGSRFGYDFESSSSTRCIGAGDFGNARTIHINRRASISAAGVAVDHHAAGQFLSANSIVGDTGAPLRRASARNLSASCVASDVAYSLGQTYTVYSDYDTSTGTPNMCVIQVYGTTTGALISASKIADTSATNIKVVVCGTVICFVYATGNNIAMVTMDSTDASNTVTVVGTIVAAAAGRAWSFDVAPLDSSTFLLAYESSATNLRWGTVTTAGVFVSKQDTATANPARPSICLGAGGNVAMIWIEGATFQTGGAAYLVSTTAGVPVTVPTGLDGSGLVSGFPVAGPASTANFAFAWNRSDGKMGSFTATGSVTYFAMLAAVSKPFMLTTTAIAANPNCVGLWTVNFAHSTLTAELATYKLIDIVGSNALQTYGAVCDVVACQGGALPGAYLLGATTAYDNRRFCVAQLTLTNSPSAAAVVVNLPVVTAKGFGADQVIVETGIYTDKFLPATINGQLFFTGGRMREFDGSRLYESGLASGPEYVTVTNAGAGSIPAGTYQYSLFYEWFDAGGRRHRSAPSTPRTITLASASNVTVTYSIPAFSDRPPRFSAGSTPNICVGICRTLNGETVFHIVNGASGLPIGSLDAATRTYTDSATDAAISVNEVLYTQGARGGLSGLLPNDEPPPCRFIWSGNSRLIVGGLEDPNEVRWSKLAFPGEPMQWSIDPAYRGKVDGEVSGVACLDGAWFVGTPSSWWVFSGEGPDDTGAGGSFGEPRKLPSDVGCISQRSIAEVPQGLLFQGRTDMMYLMPRGGGAPQPIGQAVRDTLAAYPFIVRAIGVPGENVVVFSCINSAASDGRLLIYDTRIGEWTVDIAFSGATNAARVFSSLSLWGGKLRLTNSNGIVAQSSAYADDETGSQNRAVVSTLVTGDMRPFGALGHGRFLRLALLSEYRSATTFTIELSLDGGVTYQTAASYTPSNSAGDTVKVAYDLPIVKGEAYRFRIISTPTTPGEGFVFNSITGEVYPDAGTPRLANAYRA